MIIKNDKIYQHVLAELNEKFDKIFNSPHNEFTFKPDTLFTIRNEVNRLLSEIKYCEKLEDRMFIGTFLKGTIIIAESATIMPGTVIEGPCIIGPNVRIGPSAYIHGPSIISEGSRVGHSCEIKSSVLLTGVKAYHFSFIGDSLIGHNSNVGAGTVFAVKRLDGKPVKFKNYQFKKKQFFPIKYGSLVGDNVQFGVNCSIMPGTIIPPGYSFSPNSIVKDV